MLGGGQAQFVELDGLGVAIGSKAQCHGTELGDSGIHFALGLQAGKGPIGKLRFALGEQIQRPGRRSQAHVVEFDGFRVAGGGQLQSGRAEFRHGRFQLGMTAKFR